MKLRFVIAGAWLLATPVAASEPSWTLSGFIAPQLRVWFDGGAPTAGLGAVPDARLQLDALPNDLIEGRVAVDLDMRARDEPDTKVDLRELWARAWTGDVSLTLGRQLFSWGSMGRFGVIDVLNPQQLVDTTQAWDDRKRGIDAFAASWDAPIGTFDAIWLATTRRAEVGADSPFIPGRALTGPASAVDRTVVVPDLPRFDLSRAQGALRGYFSLDRADVGAEVATLLDQNGTVRVAPQPGLRYPRWTVVAAETSVPLLEGFSLAIETMYALSHADRSGTDPLVPNDRIQFGARLRGFLSTSLQAEVGAIDHEIMAAGATGEVAVERALALPFGNPWLNVARRLGWVNLAWRFGDAMHTLGLTWLTELDRSGHMIEPTVRLFVLDGLTFETGGQIFLGSQAGLGRLDDRSNLYASLRIDF